MRRLGCGIVCASVPSRGASGVVYADVLPNVFCCLKGCMYPKYVCSGDEVMPCVGGVFYALRCPASSCGVFENMRCVAFAGLWLHRRICVL